MKILVIEDSMLYQKAIVKYLKEHLTDAEFIVSSNGLDGYEIFIKEKPDYILLDLLMPKMGGIDFLKSIQDIETKTKVFVISSDIQIKVKEEALTLGVIEFINKPFTPDKAKQLAEKIRGS